MNFEGENKDFDLIDQEKSIGNAEISPKDRLQNQIRLAVEIFGRYRGFVDLDSEKSRNEIMIFWTDDGFSKLYRDIEDSQEFKFHKRLQGDIFRLMGEDIIFYKENGHLPE